MYFSFLVIFIDKPIEFINRSTAKFGERMFLMFSKSSPVNKVPAMAIDQSRPKRKRRERGQRVLDLDLGQASCGLGHLGHARPLNNLLPEASAPWCPLCTLVSSAALLLSYPPTSCCLLYTRRPTAAPSPHLETEEYCSGKYCGALGSTPEHWGAALQPGSSCWAFSVPASKLLLICAPRRNLFSANGHDSTT